MLRQISGPQPAAPPLPSIVLFLALCVHTHMLDALAQPTERTHPGYPEGCRTRLTFASFRSGPVWLVNLAQSDFHQWEPPKYSSLLDR